MFKNIYKYTLIIIFYLILIIYSLEILTYFFINNKNTIQTDQKSLKEKNIQNIQSFDLRGDFEAFYEEKKKIKIHPTFSLNQNFLNQDEINNIFINFINESYKKNKKIPFKGPISKFTLGSNEEGIREIIKNDKYGYKNFNEVYEKKIDILLIGDSFTEGIPFGINDNISSIINLKSDYNAINLGVGGTGPLVSLGNLREYGQHFKPKNVFYLFYEGNDLIDLNREKKTYLKNYLNENYKQNLINNKDEVESFYSEYEKIFNKILPKLIDRENKIKNYQKMLLSKKNNLKEEIKDILEIQHLREILIPKDLYAFKKKNDYDLFENIIIEMKKETKKWDGEFYFVFLPDFYRYNKHFSADYFFLKRKIENIIKKNKLNFIDVDLLFKKLKLNNANTFNLGKMGHYTKEGYVEIANQLIYFLNELPN